MSENNYLGSWVKLNKYDDPTITYTKKSTNRKSKRTCGKKCKKEKLLKQNKSLKRTKTKATRKTKRTKK